VTLSLIGLIACSPLQASENDALPSAPAISLSNAELAAASLPLLAVNTPEQSALAPKPSAQAPVAPSQNVTINLINRLVQRGVLAKEDAADLIKQAEADTAQAKAQAEAAQQSAIQSAVADALSKVPVSAPQPEAEPTDDTVRVPYIPETVKAQMRDEIKQEVMDQAREEHWAAPHSLPEWTTRIRLFGDVRVRGEKDSFPVGNNNTGAFPNFNAINTGAPFDISGNQFSPQLNVDQDRERIRLRARFGLAADLGSGFSAGVRVATGENNSPTSTNQSLGLANQSQGGNFSKYAIWLDRGFIAYDLGAPGRHLGLSLGRFDNPFYSNSEIIWDDDLGFDGIALQGDYEVLKGVTPFFAAGAFPVFNTDFNFSSNQPAKFKSTDKWLYGGQLGVNWKINHDFNAKVAAAYYYFDSVEGRLSDPFVPLSASDQGNTDNTRPSFAQKGNTYRPLRNIIPTADNNYGTTNQFQYFGLATPFHELALNGQFNYDHFEPVRLSLYGDFVKNLAFDSGAINAVAVNNRGPASSSNKFGSFAGGDTAWIVGLKVGSVALANRWDWQLGANYRYVESDAVVDGFCDSDFGGGGTNLKGYSLFGNLALSPRVSVGLRWMSADQVAGPQFKQDIIQLDFTGKF
jgi:hypothetical protein